MRNCSADFHQVITDFSLFFRDFKFCFRGKFVGGATELGILRDNGDLRKLLSKD